MEKRNLILFTLLLMAVLVPVSIVHASSQFATLDAKSTPSGAEVWIDGALRGRTPVEITVIEGLHVIEMKMEGYETTSNELTLTADTTSHQSWTLQEIDLDSLPGTIIVSSEPTGAEVYVEGDYKGITPLTLNDVPKGIYTVKIVKEGYKDYSHSVSIRGGNTRTLSPELSKEFDFVSTAPIILVLFLLLGIVIKKKSSKRKTKAEKSNGYKSHKVDGKQFHPNSKISDNKADNSVINQLKDKKQNTNVKSSISKSKNLFSINRSPHGINVKSAFTYKGAVIQYKIKVENPTSEPIADVKVNLYVPDVFIVSESSKSISIIKPSESKTVTFDIRPTGECGDCEVSGKVLYYDYKTKETTETPIPAKNVSIVCPMLKSKEITESDWRNTLSGLTKAEETTKEIDMPASTLFDVVSDVLQDMNLFMLDPKVNDSGNLYRAISKFYGEGVKSLKYAAQIEVVGGSSKSKLILKAWAEYEDALTGFYHGILDEIEKRVHVKGLIDGNVVNNYHYGDNIGTQITDSVLQRSNIGTSNDSCPGCGKEIVQGEKFCMSCGTALG
jgi:hypothetical protein